MILEARDLAFGHRGRPIGRNVDLGLEPGEVLALLGPNGGGKTTLLRTLLGLLPPLGGSLFLDGRPLGAWAAAERARRMAYVPQSHAGAFAFSVADMVATGRTAHGGLFSAPAAADRAAVADALGRLGIAALADRAFTRISGGERQLVLIARAIATAARVIVLDEPTASLDFGNAGRVLDEIAALRDAGLAVLFTTHDPNLARRYADTVAMLRDGRMVATGRPGEVITAERLADLYGAPVERIGTDADPAFLPARRGTR